MTGSIVNPIRGGAASPLNDLRETVKEQTAARVPLLGSPGDLSAAPPVTATRRCPDVLYSAAIDCDDVHAATFQR